MSELPLPEEITGEGLVLRCPTPADADEFVAVCRDPLIPRFTRVPFDYQLSDFDEFLERVERAFGERKGGHFAVRETSAGPILGAGSVNLVKNGAEAGYFLAEAARGRGIATRTLRLLTEVAFQHGVPSVYLSIALDNAASVGVGERAGFTYVETRLRQPANGCGVDLDTIDLKVYERVST